MPMPKRSSGSSGPGGRATTMAMRPPRHGGSGGGWDLRVFGVYGWPWRESVATRSDGVSRGPLASGAPAA